jgi:glycosyltransferase involved in cell wall biosynthesis
MQAATRLKAKGARFEIVLAGDGEMRNLVDEFVIKESLQSTVRVTGWIDGSQVRKEILNATALILPSFAEGLPVVIMEAMALRRPVISTFVAGIPELVHPGKHGWLVPPGDLDALVQAMEDCLASDDEEIDRMGEAAQAQVRSRHDVEREATKLCRLFESLAYPRDLDFKESLCRIQNP